MNITDNEGFPISGDRIAFYIDGTETLCTIYDSDGTRIQNPQKLVNGRTEKQVFLDNIDVKAVWQTCVDEENDVWENVQAWVSYPGKYNVVVTGGAKVVDNVDALRDEDTALGTVILGGYYNSGDCPDVKYVWDPSATGSDDGCFKIKKNGVAQGRWLAVFDGDYVDVRHFGIFPQESMGEVQGPAIRSAYNTASLTGGKKLFFPRYKDGFHYEIGGCVISGAKFDTGIELYSAGGSAELVDCENAVVLGSPDGAVTITADTVSTSQNINNGNVVLNPRLSVVLDTDYGKDSVWEGMDVVVLADQTLKLNFVNCRFGGTHKFIGESQLVKFENCEIRQDMFSEDSDYDFFEFTNCSSSPSLWTSPSKYVEFCEKNGTGVIDFNGIAFNAGISLKAGVKIKNATFNSITSPLPAFPLDIELENVTLRYGAQGFFNNVKLYNSSISSINTLNCVNFEAYNSTVNNPVNCSKARVFNSTFQLDLQVKKCDIYNSILDMNVVVNPSDNGNIEDVVVSGCTFGIGNVVYFRLSAMCEASNVYVVNNILKGSTRPIVSISGYGFTSKTNYNVGGNVNSEVTRETTSATQSAFNTIITNGLLVNESAYLANVQKFRLAIYTTQSEIDRESEEGDIVVIYNNTDTNNRQFSRVVTSSGTAAIFSSYERKLAFCKYGEAGHSNKWQTI